jgi:hypothetical protein
MHIVSQMFKLEGDEGGDEQAEDSLGSEGDGTHEDHVVSGDAGSQKP